MARGAPRTHVGQNSRLAALHGVRRQFKIVVRRPGVDYVEVMVFSHLAGELLHLCRSTKRSACMSHTPPSTGDQLRAWRERQGLSQLQLALRADVSARHLSFVETGRARPGRALILRLAQELAVPLRECNTVLMAAGFAPMYLARSYDDPSFDPIRGIVNATLEHHKPFPAYLIDRYWCVVASNGAIPELYEGVVPELLEPPINVVRLMLHPRGLAPRVGNFSVWWHYYVGRMQQQLQLTCDPEFERLLSEILAYPTRPKGELAPPASSPAVPLEMTTTLGKLTFLTATTVFGSPADVTVEEIALEMLHPADPFTHRVVRSQR